VINCSEDTLEKKTSRIAADSLMSWILLSQGLCNNLQNDLIGEAMGVQ